MSEIETKYSIPCPECWNPEEGNQAVLTIIKDWTGQRYVFLSEDWECNHCDGKGVLSPQEVVVILPEVDLGQEETK